MPLKAAVLSLVFLPGFHGTDALFQPLFKALPAKAAHRCLNLPSQKILTYADLDPWLSQSLKDEGDYVLVAESFSSELAIRYAATHPPHLRGLVTVGGFSYFPGSRWYKPFVFLIPSFTSGVIARPRRKLLFGPDATLEQDALVVEAMKHYSTEALRCRLRAILRGDQRPLLPALSLPRLALHGDRDAMIPREAWQTLVDSGFEGKLIPGPHALAYVAPEKVAAEIDVFMKRVLKVEQASLRSSLK